MMQTVESVTNHSKKDAIQSGEILGCLKIVIARIVARDPLNTSQNNTTEPAFGPRTRNAFVDPKFPYQIRGYLF